MKFKNGLIYKVEPLKTYEIDLPKEDVIYRLREQDGFCRNQDSNGYELEFECFKSGKFFVKDPGTIDRQAFLQGDVIVQNGKSVVRLEKVEQKGEFVYSIISTVFISVISIVAIALKIWKGGLNDFKDLISVLLLLTLPIMSISLELKEKKAIPTDTEIMLKEVDQRILGVVRWDD